MIYKTNQIESTFIVIHNNETFTVGCIYIHPSIETNTDFNKYYLSNLIDTLSLENKEIVLLDQFNVDLLSYDSIHVSPIFQIPCALNFFFLILQVQIELLLNILWCSIFSALLQMQLNARKIYLKKPWISKGILKSIKTKNRLYKQCAFQKIHQSGVKF